MKQSLLIGALASSFGIFLSKLLGLFYYSPLSSLAGEENMVFYSYVYTYYDLLLQISSAGIPFAIASLVASYMASKDYKTVLLIKKLGTSIILGLSFITAIIFLLIATPLSKQSLGSSAPIQDIENLRNLFYLLTIAIIAVPFLSSIRGYIQGLKRLDIYGASQVLEQFVRVFTIIFGSFVFVKILKLESVMAIYVAILAASLGAIIAIIFTKFFSKNDLKHVEELAIAQEFDSNLTTKAVFKEIMAIGIPYLIISFLSSAGPLVNTTFFLDYITKVHGSEVYDEMKLASGILQANVAKIANIPSVLALGFGSGMVPYLAESLQNKDEEKINEQVNSIIDATNLILVPMIFVFIFFAKDIYYIFYGNNNLELGAKLFAISTIQIFLGTIAPIFSSIMMSLKLRKESILTLIICFLIKVVSFFPLVKRFYAYGMIYSSAIYYLLQILLYFYFLRKQFKLNVLSAFKRLFLITICSFLSVIIPYGLYQFMHFNYDSRLLDNLYMAFLGILMLVIYYLLGKKTSLFKKMFKLEDDSLKDLIKRLRS